MQLPRTHARVWSAWACLLAFFMGARAENADWVVTPSVPRSSAELELVRCGCSIKWEAQALLGEGRHGEALAKFETFESLCRPMCGYR